MVFSGVPTRVEDIDPPLASYLKGAQISVLNFQKNYKRIEILQLKRNFLKLFQLSDLE